MLYLKALEKLKRQLAEAEAELEARKKPSEDTTGPKFIGEGLVIDEWVSYATFKLLLGSCCLPSVLMIYLFRRVCRKREERDTWLGNRGKG